MGLLTYIHKKGYFCSKNNLMIGILIVIGLCVYAYRQYSETAFEFHKSNVGFGFAGIGFFLASYVLFQFIAGIILGLFMPAMLLNFGALLIIGVISYVVGILAALWILKAFKNAWTKERNDKNLLDD